jgi:hypothetical protein
VAVKVKYGAWVTQAEHDAIARELGRCPAEPLPASDHPVESDLGAATGSRASGPPAAPAVPAAGCDAAYPDVCIPSPSAVGDLDCADVPDRDIRVLAPDPHRFDADGDGAGCVSG